MLAAICVAFGCLLDFTGARNTSDWLLGRAIPVSAAQATGILRFLARFFWGLSALVVLATTLRALFPRHIRVSETELDLPWMLGRRRKIRFEDLVAVEEIEIFGRRILRLAVASGSDYHVEAKALEQGAYDELVARIRLHNSHTIGR